MRDDDPPSPMDWDGAWTLVSFLRKFNSYRSPDEYVRRGSDGLPEPRTLGFRRKHDVGLLCFLDYFQHGDGDWRLHGEGTQDCWDNSLYAGILLWEHKPAEMGAKMFEDRAAGARRFLWRRLSQTSTPFGRDNPIAFKTCSNREDQESIPTWQMDWDDILGY